MQDEFQETILHHAILDVVSGNAIVARVEAAAGDLHISIPPIETPSEVNSVPAAFESSIANTYFGRSVKEECVVRGVTDRYSFERNVMAIRQENCVRTTHPCLAFRIEDLVAVDHAGARDRDVLQPLAHNQAAIPTTVPPVFRLESHVDVKILAANQS